MFATFAVSKSWLIPHPIHADKFVANVPGKGVLSIQPDGRVEYRIPGTSGAWETLVISGNRAIYNEIDGLVYVLPLED